MELGDLDLGGLVLDLSLNDIDVPVLYGEQLSLIEQFVMLLVVLIVDGFERSCMFFLLKLLLSLLHFLQFPIKSLLLFLALFLELGTLVAKTRLFLNQCRDCHDFVLLDRALLNLGVELRLLSSDFVNFLLILLFFIFKLSQVFTDGVLELRYLSLLDLLLLKTRGQFFNFGVVVFLLLLVEGNRIVLNDFFFHSLELVDVFLNHFDVLSEDLVELVALDSNSLPLDHRDFFIELAFGLFEHLFLNG